MGNRDWARGYICIHRPIETTIHTARACMSENWYVLWLDRQTVPISAAGVVGKGRFPCKRRGRGRGRDGLSSQTREMAALAKLQDPDTKLTINGEIGRGAWCVAFEGELNGKPVAVKRTHSLLLEYAGSERTLPSSMLHRSALLLKQLSHPHIVKFMEFYESEDGDHTLVMERLDCNLRSYLERHAGKLSRERQIDFCLQIADAVHYLHSQQPPVAYRDLSGRKVLLSGDGMLKLCLCLQAARLPSCGYFDDSQPGMLVYMPPETLTHDARYDEKMDIFSLGVVMLQIATQCSPTVGVSGIGTVPEIIRRIDDLSRLPEDHPLKPIILQCLRDDPGERPDSGAVFRMLSEG